MARRRTRVDYNFRSNKGMRALNLGVAALGLTVALGFGYVVYTTMGKVDEFNSDYQKMIHIANDRKLHPTYGNYDQRFDLEEMEGVARDLGLDMKERKRFPSEQVKKYIEMYK